MVRVLAKEVSVRAGAGAGADSGRPQAVFKLPATAAEILRTDEADYATLRGHGFDDEDIWDIAAITAFFGLSNRLANVTGMRPNDEFFLMGRLPKALKP